MRVVFVHGMACLAVEQYLAALFAENAHRLGQTLTGSAASEV